MTKLVVSGTKGQCNMDKLFRRKKELNSFQIIIFGFAGVILLGALLLMLPISSRTGQVTPFLDCLFTSTSAVCVTGLVVYDTAHPLVCLWSGTDSSDDSDRGNGSHYGGSLNHHDFRP